VSGKAASDYAEDYTEPELRARLKDEIKAGDRGGAAGRWSARKSQLLVQEYEKAGGGYRHAGEPTKDQEDLRRWTDQDWETKDGASDARGEDGTSRYLPRIAWELLTDSERAATDDRKRRGSEQVVDNTAAAREARQAAELIDATAAEAAKAVRRMDSASALERAHQAETQHGKSRKTVLRAIERQRHRLR
jgi:hypothetical protein